MTKTKSELISIDGAAAMLGISRRTLFRLRSSGQFPEPDAKIGRRDRWKIDTIQRWIDDGGSAE